MNPPALFFRHISRLTLIVLLLAARGGAATRTYDAEAAPVAQIDSIDIGGTWLATETYSVTIGNSTLTVTLGSDTLTVVQVASTVKNAINAASIDENKVGAEKRNAAGQLLPEFRDVEAIIDPADTSIVLCRSRVAGVPFGTPSGGNLTVSETSASGTITRASVQAATGPWHWSNATNWSSNTAPVNDDVVVFQGTSRGPKYGLPNASLEVAIQVHMSFTDWIGLKPINTANGMPYGEYRQQDVRLDNAGTGTAITHIFGLGSGPGSGWINITHTSAADLVTSVTVVNTGSPAGGSRSALSLKITNPSGAGTVTVSNGFVEIGRPTTGSAFETLNLGVGGDVVLYEHADDLTANVSGGTLEVIESTGNGAAGTRTFVMNAGSVLCRNVVTSGDVAFQCMGGQIIWNADKTIDSLMVAGTGVFNAEQVRSAFTITDCDLYRGGSILDTHGRATFTNGIDFDHCSLSDTTVRVGAHKRHEFSAIP